MKVKFYRFCIVYGLPRKSLCCLMTNDNGNGTGLPRKYFVFSRNDDGNGNGKDERQRQRQKTTTTNDNYNGKEENGFIFLSGLMTLFLVTLKGFKILNYIL